MQHLLRPFNGHRDYIQRGRSRCCMQMRDLAKPIVSIYVSGNTLHLIPETFNYCYRMKSVIFPVTENEVPCLNDPHGEARCGVPIASEPAGLKR